MEYSSKEYNKCSEQREIEGNGIIGEHGGCFPIMVLYDDTEKQDGSNAVYQSGIGTGEDSLFVYILCNDDNKYATCQQCQDAHAIRYNYLDKIF